TGIVAEADLVAVDVRHLELVHRCHAGDASGDVAGSGTVSAVDLRQLQDTIERTYGDRDRDRGVAPTVAWLVEELGELAQAVRKGTRAEIEHEFGDVIAWV